MTKLKKSKILSNPIEFEYIILEVTALEVNMHRCINKSNLF